MNTTKQPSRFQRLVLASGLALAITGSVVGVGAYSYLKPTASSSAPIESVYASVLDPATNRYIIDSGSAKVSFRINEVLRGSAYTVVGKTDQVAGEFTFDPENPAAAELGAITINARTLTTDDDTRNRALGNQILNTSDYEYITFTPTSLSGLPGTVTTGQPFTFQALGDLTIKDVTKPATFAVTVTPEADGSVLGSATSTINYTDWGVSIPSVPFVASVDKQVTLALSFTA
jgi:polyisoprenoid-binding protein YceI